MIEGEAAGDVVVPVSVDSGCVIARADEPIGSAANPAPETRSAIGATRMSMIGNQFTLVGLRVPAGFAR